MMFHFCIIACTIVSRRPTSFFLHLILDVLKQKAEEAQTFQGKEAAFTGTCHDDLHNKGKVCTVIWIMICKHNYANVHVHVYCILYIVYMLIINSFQMTIDKIQYTTASKQKFNEETKKFMKNM